MRNLVQEEMESEEDEIYQNPDLQDKKIMEDGYYYQSKIYTDYQYMLLNTLPIPDAELRSAYYAIEHNGIIYHVFNAERIVTKII